MGTLDAVFGAEVYARAVESDVVIGFDFGMKNVDDLLNNVELSSIPFCKVSGKEARYVLLELRVEGEGKEFVQNYLRGFEKSRDYHLFIVEDFLDEIKSKVGNCFKLPISWAETCTPDIFGCNREVVAQNDGLRLTITVVGGALYDLKNNCIISRGESDSFGPIPAEYQSTLLDLSNILIQKEPYTSFKFNQE